MAVLWAVVGVLTGLTSLNLLLTLALVRRLRAMEKDQGSAAVPALPTTAAWTFKVLLDAIVAPGGAGTARVVSLAVITALAGLGTPLIGSLVSYVSLAIRSAVTVAAEDALFRAVNRQAGLRCFERPEFLDRLRLAEEAAATAPSTVNDFALTRVQTAAIMAGFGGR